MSPKSRLQPTKTQRNSTSNPPSSLHSPSQPIKYTLSSPVDYVKDFFRYRPKELGPSGGHTKSTGTRAPQFFDKHLHESLRLRHVVNLSSIPSDLAKVAQHALESYPGDLPKINKEFPTPKNRSKAFKFSGHDKMQCENDVEQFYYRTTAGYCEVVAGTLAFKLREWSKGCLQWRLRQIADQKPSGGPRNRAVADGLLNIVEEGGPQNLSKLHHDIIQNYPELAIWEFKNLNFSKTNSKREDQDPLHKVVNNFLDCWFPWETCELGDECNTTHEDGVTGRPTGHDAKNHPCASLQQARYKQSQCDYGPMPTFSNLKDFLKAFPVTPRYILQQAWAQAVRHDATFIVIQAGNLEIICIRDRKTQTLYVSDVIEVTKCNYGELHTGLYIAAYRDAEQRTLLLRQALSPSPGQDLKFGFDEDKAIVLTGIDEEAGAGMLWQEACRRHWLKIIPDPQSQNHTSYAANTLYKRVPPFTSSLTLPTPDGDTFFRLLAKPPFFGHLICRATLRIPGVIFDKGNKTLNRSIQYVLKNASDPTVILRRRREYMNYLLLRHAGVPNLPEVIGLFEYINEEHEDQSFAVLVLEDMGQSLDQLLQETDGEPFIVTKEQIECFMKKLRAIHDADWSYGKLTSRSLMFRGAGRGTLDVSIIGFADAEILGDVPRLNGDTREVIIDRERRSLLSLLPTNPLTRKPGNADLDQAPARKLRRR